MNGPSTSHTESFGAGLLGRTPAAPSEPEAAGGIRGASGGGVIARTSEGLSQTCSERG